MLSDTQKKWAEEFLDKCENKIYNVIDDVTINYPMAINSGFTKYDQCKPRPFNWTSGFFGGIMWLLYLQTGKEKYKQRAIACSERTQEIFGNNENFYCLDNHDLGFVISPTSVAHYRILGDKDAKIRGLHSASVLAGRFNLNGRYFRAWGHEHPWGNDKIRGYAIMDCLLNMPLLYWASEVTDDPRYYALAKAHTDTVVKEFVKPDGSVYHIVDFDPYSGKAVGYPKGQGYASGSSWSRGQGWAIYGFMMAYIHTNEEEFLKKSQGVADYIINNMQDFSIPPVDYEQPSEPRIIDSSAGAVTACGMLELAKALGPNEGNKYAEFAIKLLEGLYDDCDFTDKNQAILQSYREQYFVGSNTPVIYADYFLIEALMKCVGKTDFFMW